MEEKVDAELFCKRSFLFILTFSWSSLLHYLIAEINSLGHPCKRENKILLFGDKADLKEYVCTKMIFYRFVDIDGKIGFRIFSTNGCMDYDIVQSIGEVMPLSIQRPRKRCLE